MSKSASSDLTRINMIDDKDQIYLKIKKAKTDSFAGLEFGNNERPECDNLLTIYEVTSGYTRVRR